MNYLEAFENENKTIRELSRASDVPELEVIKALTANENVALFGKDEVMPLLTELAELTTPSMIIVENQGSIFEMKCRFPKGAEGYGFYNFKIEGDAGLGGHMDINHIAHVAVTSEIFFNKPSKSWWFIHENGKVVFKVFVGREDDGEFRQEHLALFDKWLKK